MIGSHRSATDTNEKQCESRISNGCIRSSELLNESGFLQIEHNGKRYLLRKTRNNKLILTS